jgi:ketosteroid isomerase-like protein
MKKALLPLLGIAALFIFQSCTSKQGESNEAMLKAARELDGKFIEAFNSGDAEAMSALYWNSPDLVSMPPDEMAVTGWDNVKASFIRMYENLKGAKLELTESHDRVEGSVVLGWGKWTLTLPDESGTKMMGRYSDVKANKDGKWVYIMDHGSVPLPPPGQ